MRAMLLILTPGLSDALSFGELQHIWGGSAPTPTIQIRCSVESVDDVPTDEPDIYATELRVASDQRELYACQGHDNLRHHSMRIR